MTTIGILGLQGNVAAHARAVTGSGGRAVPIRRPGELDVVDGLILPGGESTTLLKLMDDLDLTEPVRRFHGSGRPLFGTCAGAILVAARVTGPEQRSLGLIDIDIERNGWGRQRDSFEASASPGAWGASVPPDDEAIPLVFIRAPRIRRCGPGVDVLLTWGGEPILVRQGGVLASTFHPEMADDPRIHGLFHRMALDAQRSGPAGGSADSTRLRMGA